MAAELEPDLSRDGTFPDDPIFRQLLDVAGKATGSVISDPSLVLEMTYDEFLTEVVNLRRRVKRSLAPFFQHGNRLLPDKSLVCVLAPANHEFAVAAFVILALGGTIVPVRTSSD
jgi:malonyl-CoA/methylmalonyl-CoA synthetase